MLPESMGDINTSVFTPAIITDSPTGSSTGVAVGCASTTTAGSSFVVGSTTSTSGVNTISAGVSYPVNAEL